MPVTIAQVVAGKLRTICTNPPDVTFAKTIASTPSIPRAVQQHITVYVTTTGVHSGFTRVAKTACESNTTHRTTARCRTTATATATTTSWQCVRTVRAEPTNIACAAPVPAASPIPRAVLQH
eukprot:159946-Rhodomonas_salina.1